MASRCAASMSRTCRPSWSSSARSRLAVSGTGDEMLAVDAEPQPWQVRNANKPMLVALLRRLGCEVSDLGVVRDDRDAIAAAFMSAAREYDALFITGGMSMGNYDLAPRVLREIGATLEITKLRIKPGKPFVFGAIPGTTSVKTGEPAAQPLRGGGASRCYVFGLPGNPVSSFACTVRLCSRLIDRMGGG